MTSISPIATALQTVLITAAEQAAHDTGFIVRQRRLKGAQFVQTVVGAWLAYPDATESGASRPGGAQVGRAGDSGAALPATSAPNPDRSGRDHPPL
jgi:hypothetical protein